MMDFERAAMPYWPIRRRKLLRRNLALFAALVLLAGGLFAYRYHLAHQSMAARVFDEVSSTVALRYYDRSLHGLDWQAMIGRYRPRVLAAQTVAERYRLMQAMLASLGDSHTAVFSPAEVASAGDTSDLALGAALVRIGNDDVVLRVAPNSPAANAGFRPGYIVAERSQTEGSPLSRSFAVRDPASGHTWQRRVQLTSDAAYDSVARPDIDWGNAAPGIGYLRLASFPNGIQEALGWAVSDISSNRSLILDLRGNPGGLIDAVDAAAGIFLPAGSLVVSGTGRYHVFRRAFTATAAAGVHYDGKLAVLVDGTSESGAEALASALQRHHRAVIVGQQTARKVLCVEV